MVTETVRNEVGGAGRALGKQALDTYEKAVHAYVQLEQKAAVAAPVDWAKTAITAHASFVQEVSGAYVKAARELLD